MVSLDTLTPGEAAGLLARLADRPDVTAGDPEVTQIAALCGYLPLAIGMTARQLAHHPAWTAAGLAGELAAAKQRLELMAAENVSVAAAFGLSYRDLTAARRRLFRRLGLHPGPHIDAYAAAALAGIGVAAARRRLEVLYDQHLITEPARGRYRFHDLIREHAGTLAAADDPAARDAAATGLLDYYLHTARAASGHFPSWTNAGSPAPPGRPPGSAPPVSTPRQATGWLEAERANLHAAAGYAAATGAASYAVSIPAAMAGFLESRGYWDQGLVPQQAALAAARRAGDRLGQARALMLLSPMQAMTEDTPAAVASATGALQLYRDLGDRAGQAEALTGSACCTRSPATSRLPPLHCARRWSCSVTSATGAGKAMPSTTLATCTALPGTTRPPPPASGRHCSCTVTPVTGGARPAPSGTWVPCSN